MGVDLVKPGQITSQIIPIWIDLLDQPNFPGAVPFLELLLAGNGVVDAVVEFDIDQSLYIVAVGKSYLAVQVLLQAPTDVGGNADVQRAATFAGENVDTGFYHEELWRRWSVFPRHPAEQRGPFLRQLWRLR